jgi:hypothetical protein
MANYSLMTNLAIGVSPWLFDANYLKTLPKVPGVYVYGVKVIINGVDKFMPLYVGIRNDIKSRLTYHYKQNGIQGNGKKELFDIASIHSQNDVIRIYNDMRFYDSKSGLNPLRIGISSLVWFNNPVYFDSKLKLPAGTSKYRPNEGQQSSIKIGGDLDLIGTNNSINLKQQIQGVKKIYTDKFFYAFSTLDSIVAEILEDSNHPQFEVAFNYNKKKQYTINRKNGPGKDLCELIENTLKNRFSSIGINTSAKSTGKMLPVTDKFDLSCIQNDLINLTGKPFINPLIL